MRLETEGTQSVAVHLLMVNVPVEYRIKDVKKYLYQYDEPHKLVEAVAYQYLSDQAAGVNGDVLMGPGREKFNHELRRSIQQRLDELDLGVEIVFLGLRGAHPPAENGVAKAYHSAIGAQITKLATIATAEAEVRRVLTTVAGTEARARALDAAVRERDRLQSDSSAESGALEAARMRVKHLLLGDPSQDIAPMSGEAAAIIADARAAASELLGAASAKVRGFATEVAAYTASPGLYKQRKILDVYAQMNEIRKFLVLGEATNIIIEYMTSEEGGLDRVLTESVEKQKQKG
jgi:regulator of protease activity HflC (stomatin/prohibitin superfamily)